MARIPADVKDPSTGLHFCTRLRRRNERADNLADPAVIEEEQAVVRAVIVSAVR